MTETYFYRRPFLQSMFGLSEPHQFSPGFFSDFAGVAVAAGDAEAAGGVVAGDAVAEGAGVATVAGDGEAPGFALFVSGSLQAANVNEIASTKNSFFIMIISF